MANVESVAERQMPLYQCHKQVRALKIAAIQFHEDGSASIIPARPDFGEFKTKPGYRRRFPETDIIGPDDYGYYVVYEDGYESWSPTAAFEAGYTLESNRIADIGFTLALRRLMNGRRIARAGWNGKGMWLHLQRPDDFSKMSRPYIYMKTVEGDLVPWVASQTDLLAEDWEVLAE